MTVEDLKIIAKGFLGSMTFGAYHIYTTTHMINETNRNNQLRIDELNKNNEIRINELNKNNQLRIDELNKNNQMRINELMKKIEKIENRRFF
jgi:hypothetical protein